MSINKIITEIITKDKKEFINFSDSPVLQSNRSRGNGCCTFIHAGKSIRLRFSADLLSDIGNPEAVIIRIADKKLGVFPASIDAYGATKVSADRLLYNNGLVQMIINQTNVSVKDTGSTSSGKYIIQQDDDESTYAVVSFD